MNERTERITIVDVARAAGTSVSSASVALRGEPGVSERTRSRILRTAEQLGYQPDQRARVLREQRSRLLGVTFAVHQAFDTELVESLYRAAAGTGYDLVLSATTGSRSGADAVGSLLRDRCSTMILISPQLSTEQLVELSRRAAVVIIGSDLQAAGTDSVRSDDRRGITDAVDHLVALGHRSISYVDGGPAVLSAERRDGFLAAMAEHGLSAHAQVLTGQPTEESGVEVAERLLTMPALPTAVLAHNDMIAFGMLLTLRANGIAVPGEVSLIGYDDTRLAGLSTIGLTSVSQDAGLLARTAIARAVARAENPSIPAPEFVTPPVLIVRGTTGPPRDSVL